MWLCRSPRMSSQLDQPRQRPVARRPPARRGSRAAPARCRRGRGARRPPARSRTCAVTPVASSRMPYSETCSPLRTAASRSAALCAPEPVKCCSRLPSCAGCGDPQVDADARVGARPGARLAGRADAARSARAWPGSWPASVGRVVVAIRSMSLTRSACRRTEPASCDVRAGSPPRALRPATSASPISIARGSRMRGAGRASGLGVQLVERREHARLELRAESAHGAQALRSAPPRAAPAASRCRAPSAAAARASGPGRAGA